MSAAVRPRHHSGDQQGGHQEQPLLGTETVILPGGKVEFQGALWYGIALEACAGRIALVRTMQHHNWISVHTCDGTLIGAAQLTKPEQARHSVFGTRARAAAVARQNAADRRQALSTQLAQRSTGRAIQ